MIVHVINSFRAWKSNCLKGLAVVSILITILLKDEVEEDNRLGTPNFGVYVKNIMLS